MGIMHHNQAAHTANAIATVAKTSNDLYDYTVNPAVGDANLQLGAVESVIRLASQDNASQETQVPTGCHAYYMGDQSDAPAAYTAVCQNGSQAGISSHRLKSLCEEINCASVLNLQTKAAFRLQSALNAANSQQKVQEKDMLLSALVWSACYATPLDCAAHQNAIIAGSRDAQENVLLVKLGDAQSNLEHPLKIACRNAGALYSSSHVDSPEMQEYLTNTSKSVHVVCLVSHQANVAKQLVGLANLVKAVNKSNMESPSITVVFLDSQTTMNVQHNTSKALWGACRTMRMEYPSLQLTTIQMDAHMDKSQAALYLVSEIQNKHSTEKEVMYKNATRYINTIVEKYPSASQHLSLNPHLEKLQRGSYVITGGLGGLGLVTAQLLADMGATSISLLSRSGIIQRTDQNLNAILDKVREKANVEVIACDVSKEDHVRNLYTKQNHPCVGIIHAAGVLRDGLAANLNHTQVQQVFDPKISGALHLHHNTLLQPLQVCIMFSSIASLYGSIGQTSYSAANTYLDTLAALRQNQGLPAVSIQWPAISGIGMWEGLSSVHKKTTPFTLAVTDVVKVMKHLVSSVPIPAPNIAMLPQSLVHDVNVERKQNDKNMDPVVDTKDPSWYELPSQWKQLQVTKLSNNFSEATSMQHLNTLDCEENEVVVRVIYAGVNASDVNFSAGKYHGSEAAATKALPFAAGLEGVGLVVKKGSKTKISIGSPVACMAPGCYSDFLTIKESSLLTISEIQIETVALLTSGLTATLALSQVGQMKNGGETVLVTAAAGGTGQFAVQLAKLAGNRVIATCSNPRKKDLLEELGAERVINYKLEDVQKVLKEEYPRGISLVYDGVGGKLLQNILPAVSPLGRIVTIGAVSTYQADEESALKQEHMQSLYQRGVSILGFYLPAYKSQFQKYLNQLCDLHRTKKLRVHVDVKKRYCGAEMAPDAVKDLHSGKTQGKVVVQIPQHVPKTFKDLSAQLKTNYSLNTNAVPKSKDSNKMQVDVVSLTSQVQKTIEQAVIDTIGETIDTESPLMEAGVDSLASSELINKINDDMGTSLAPTILFDYPTIQDLTQHLVQTLPDATDHAIEAVERIPNHDPMHAPAGGKLHATTTSSRDRRCLVLVVHGIGSSAEFLARGIRTFLPPSFEVVGLDRPGFGSWSSLVPSESMKDVLAHMCDNLPVMNRPVIILGYSYGSFIGYELAKVLSAKGVVVRGLIVAALPSRLALSKRTQARLHEIKAQIEDGFLPIENVNAEMVKNHHLREAFAAEFGGSDEVLHGDAQAVTGSLTLTHYDVAVTTKYLLETPKSTTDKLKIPALGLYNLEDAFCSEEEIKTWSEMIEVGQSFRTNCTGERGHMMFVTKPGLLKLAMQIQEFALFLDIP
ncbi:alcohol dehydrogenase [Chloropicon primus]|uniref:Alcohol dehydrogenase n=1 Tax=Chloropicon primus TaxID=1764295 RepID=A0A5B8MQV2_9CHLO|nr:alcohol dehydrogenase [Chloropicon primus]|eukprot:QDZ21995.1 alcohol dehydrogenase [Chloropicon primus]